MLWRGVRDCPRVRRNVDFICGDAQIWLGGFNQYTSYDPSEFFQPEDQEDA
jgi:hypothetical protein